MSVLSALGVQVMEHQHLSLNWLLWAQANECPRNDQRLAGVFGWATMGGLSACIRSGPYREEAFSPPSRIGNQLNFVEGDQILGRRFALLLSEQLSLAAIDSVRPEIDLNMTLSLSTGFDTGRRAFERFHSGKSNALHLLNTRGCASAEVVERRFFENFEVEIKLAEVAQKAEKEAARLRSLQRLERLERSRAQTLEDALHFELGSTW